MLQSSFLVVEFLNIRCCVGRAANGKGHYWSIHPANLEDFHRGDFRRRKAQRKVRKHMGLSCPDDEDSSRSPSPAHSAISAKPPPDVADEVGVSVSVGVNPTATERASSTGKKRAFDVESLLQPDDRKAGQADPKGLKRPLGLEDDLEQSHLAQQYFASLSAFCMQQGCSSTYLAALANCASLNCTLIN